MPSCVLSPATHSSARDLARRPLQVGNKEVAKLLREAGAKTYAALQKLEAAVDPASRTDEL